MAERGRHDDRARHPDPAGRGARDRRRAGRGAHGARSAMSSSRTTSALLQRCAPSCTRCRARCACWKSTAPRCWPRRWSRSARYLIGTARRAQEPGRGARRADARDGAAARLPRARAGRRPRPGAGAAAAAERPARGARQRAAVRRHAAAAQPEVRPPGAAVGAGAGRAAADVGAVGAAAARRASRPGWSAGSAASGSEQNLEMLATVATRSSRWRRSSRVFQLWWVVGALIEALREHGLESSVSVKRLLGLADREIQPAVRAGRGALRAACRRSSCSTTCCITWRAPPPPARAWRRCAPRSASTSCCRWTRASSRSARTCRRPRSS